MYIYLMAAECPMKATISKWGNSCGVRIPARLADDLNLAPGSEVEISHEGRPIRIVPVEQAKVPEYSLKDLLAGITKENIHGETLVGGAVGREVIE